MTDNRADPPPDGLASELARLDRAIAELAATNVKLDRERKDIAGKLKVARYRREVLAHAIAERARTGRGRPGGRDRGAGRPARGAGGAGTPTGGTSGPTGGTAGGGGSATRPPGQAPPAGSRRRVLVAPLPRDASASSIQTIMLGLGALLLGIAAVAFVGAAFTDVDPVSQLAILLAVAALFLTVPPVTSARGLTATAETLAAVGLLVFGVAGYPLWGTGLPASLPTPVYVGLVAAATAAVGHGYAWVTRLTVPRFAALAALQPVLPLLAAPLVTAPAGWALVFALLAALDAALAPRAGNRPLTLTGWALHAAALALAAGYAVAGLLTADAVADAAPAAAGLVAAGAAGLVGGLTSDVTWRIRLGAGVSTLAVTGAAARLTALALPGRSLLPVTVIVALAALATRTLPARARPGARQAATGALVALGVVVAGLALRAGAAALVWPPWSADLTGPDRPFTPTAGAGEGQLLITAIAVTVAAGLAVPARFRRELTVVGAGCAALAAPASLGLAPRFGAWVMVVVAAGLVVTGLTVTTRRAAVCHLAAAGVVAVTATGAALAAPALTATVLAALVAAGAVAAGRPDRGPARLVSAAATGVAAVLAPVTGMVGAVAAGVPTAVVTAGAAAVCVGLGYVALVQLRERTVPLPVRAGAVVGAVGPVVVAIGSAAVADVTLAVLLLATAGLVVAAPRLESLRRPYHRFDSADLAAGLVTVAAAVTLARITTLTLPVTGADAGLAVAAALVLLVAVWVRGVPSGWRRGPVVGVAALGALVAGVAAAAAVVAGARSLAWVDPGRADLAVWPAGPVAGLSWSVPVSLVLLAVAAVTVLPAPPRHHAGPALVVLATVSAPVGLGLPWWTSAGLAGAVGAGYALLAVGVPAGRPVDRWSPPRAAWPRAVAATALAGYAAWAGLARGWLTVAVAGWIVLVGVTVAVLAVRRARTDPRLRIGGVAVTGALLAFPGMLAALAARLGPGVTAGLPAALAGAGLGLAVTAYLHALLPAPSPVRRPSPVPAAGAAGTGATRRSRRPRPVRAGPPLRPYLPFVTVGVTAAATVTALASTGTGHPTGVYAGAAVLLAVLAELVRDTPPAVGRPGPAARPRVGPPLGALAAAALPTAATLVAIGPALVTALATPYRTLPAIWQGPPPGLVDTAAVPATSVLAALLLTLAAALAAVGFGGAMTRQLVPLTAPGLAVTLLIAPPALDAPWPVGTVAALAVFTIAVLGVALTPPPPATARPLRVNRLVALGIGLVAGAAGLAGSLADPLLTWATFGGAVLVGGTAAVAGRTRPARVLGWLGAAAAAQLFALTTAYLLGADRPRAGFALLIVASVALLVVPWLRRGAASAELTAWEGLGGYGSLLLAVPLAAGSPTDLAALLTGAGTVLGAAALRVGRPLWQRRVLWWTGVVSMLAAWWIMMWRFDTGLIEAYTLPVAVLALLVGALERRHRPELGSWLTYGPGLAAAFGPSLLLALTTAAPDPGRHAGLVLGGVLVLLLGSRLGQRAPVIVGSVVTALAALHLLSLAGPWLLLIPVGLLLLVLGANREKRQRDLARLRGAYSRMR